MLLIPIALAALHAPETTGLYVEARTASVFAGACHYGGEYTTDGRDAVLGWRFDSGPLAGCEVAAVVSAGENLAEADAARRSVVYLDLDASPEARAAARAWLEREHAALLGQVVRVVLAPVEVARDGDLFRVRAGEHVALAGSALPDRACCRMPLDVWYEPLVPVAGALVGNTREFRVDEPALGRAWSRPNENAAFFGSLPTE